MSAVTARRQTTRAARMTIAGAACICWGYLLAHALAPASPQVIARMGPGMELFAALKTLAPVDSIAALVNASMCSPVGVQWGIAGFAGAFTMWLAMAVAMLLPETGRMSSSRSQSCVALLAGYVMAWIPYCGIMTFAQWLLWQQGYLNDHMVSTSMGLNILIASLAAALYLLSWPVRDGGSRESASAADTSEFAAGLKFGVSMMRCGAPLMLLMFAVGLMNIVAMAALTAIMCGECRIRDGLWPKRCNTALTDC